MNIAILIGVSDYRFASPLPACAADVIELSKVLVATKKYAEILVITTNTDSSSIKNAIRTFFAKYQGEEINEAFVYFSGHGTYHGEDALLCCSDFDHKRPSSTSISNSEIDDLLRSIGPLVAVKVIDACQSGSPYIKDVGAGFEKALKTSNLGSFICMASSRQDQFSYASAEASFFTEKWIDAALRRDEGEVMYRDIQAGLADAFVDNPDQTPFFVVQGSGLELFASVTDEMRKLRKQRSSSFSEDGQKLGVHDKVAAAITRLEAMFVTQDQASNAIYQASESLRDHVLADELIARFYSKNLDVSGQLVQLPRVKDIAQFASEQGWEKNYFMKIIHRRVVNRAELGKTSIKNIPSGIESTEPLPAEVLKVSYEPGPQTLKAFLLYIGFVHSVEELMVLSGLVELTAKGWSDRRPDYSQIKWRFQSFAWGDVVKQPRIVWDDVASDAEQHIRAYLESLVQRGEDETARHD